MDLSQSLGSKGHFRGERNAYIGFRDWGLGFTNRLPTRVPFGFWGLTQTRLRWVEYVSIIFQLHEAFCSQVKLCVLNSSWRVETLGRKDDDLPHKNSRSGRHAREAETAHLEATLEESHKVMHAQDSAPEPSTASKGGP